MTYATDSIIQPTAASMVRDLLSGSLPQPQTSTLNRLTGSRVPQSDFFLFQKNHATTKNRNASFTTKTCGSSKKKRFQFDCALL
ncbi:hypothetical protein CPT76_26215 [Paenibacillus sp. AR247]|nr:hypothetical protein CPT76_26215 [Paenibacillus sp. AR247]